MVRAAGLLGLFLCALGACAPADTHARAAADDRRYGTTLFTWLVDHEPSAVIAWRVPPETVRDLLPASTIVAAGAGTSKDVCAQAGRRHALVFLVRILTTARSDRTTAEDCGFVLARDAGAIVVAPR